MDTSTPIGKELAAALASFQAEVPDIKKSADNPFFKSKYAPLDAIIPAIKAPMKAHGLVFVQVPVGADELTTHIVHAPTGQSISGTIKMTPKDSSPQGHGSAITYARRYALVSMLGLNTDEDDDGHAASGPVEHKEAPKPAPSKASPPPPEAPKPGCISVPQAKRFFAIARANGKSAAAIIQYLTTTFGVSKSEDIPRARYDEAVAWAQATTKPEGDDFEVSSEDQGVGERAEIPSITY